MFHHAWVVLRAPSRIAAYTSVFSPCARLPQRRSLTSLSSPSSFSNHPLTSGHSRRATPLSTVLQHTPRGIVVPAHVHMLSTSVCYLLLDNLDIMMVDSRVQRPSVIVHGSHVTPMSGLSQVHVKNHMT